MTSSGGRTLPTLPVTPAAGTKPFARQDFRPPDVTMLPDGSPATTHARQRVPALFFQDQADDVRESTSGTYATTPASVVPPQCRRSSLLTGNGWRSSTRQQPAAVARVLPRPSTVVSQQPLQPFCVTRRPPFYEHLGGFDISEINDYNSFSYANNEQRGRAVNAAVARQGWPRVHLIFILACLLSF